MRHARRAIEGQPTSHALLVLGILELRQNHLAEAEAYCLSAIRLFPEFSEAHHTLGQTYVQSGRLDDAFRCFAEATKLRPWYLSAYEEAGKCCSNSGSSPRPTPGFRRVWSATPITPRPTCFAATLGSISGNGVRRSKITVAPPNWSRKPLRTISTWLPHSTKTNAAEEARRQYRQGLTLDRDWPERAAEQAWHAATSPGSETPLPEKTLQLARQACEATEPNTPPRYLDALAAAYANAGQFEQAAATAQRCSMFSPAAKTENVPSNAVSDLLVTRTDDHFADERPLRPPLRRARRNPIRADPRTRGIGQPASTLPACGRHRFWSEGDLTQAFCHESRRTCGMQLSFGAARSIKPENITPAAGRMPPVRYAFLPSVPPATTHRPGPSPRIDRHAQQSIPTDEDVR